MQVIETIRELRRVRATFGPVGFVPTMGYLHEGHLSLVRRARSECEAVVVSIFVNPTQFGPGEDYERYPRDRDRDLTLLEREQVDIAFLPQVTEMYPPDDLTTVQVRTITEVLEGACRPGHFRGVTTVVCKLFNIVQPTRAYFGQKDAQQVVVVRRMVRDLHMPIALVVVPTVREADGLALSSRNVYLAPHERAAAPVLFRALCTAQQCFVQEGERNGEKLRMVMRQVLAAEPLAQPDYVSVADPDTLQELEQVGDSGALLSLAVRIGTTRLIDNILIGRCELGADEQGTTPCASA